MARIPAYVTEYDLALVVTMFDLWGQVKRRTFYLRNLAGGSLEEQVEEAKGLADELVEEIRHITGVGIDKIDVMRGRNKVEQVTMGLEPHPLLKYFKQGLRFRLEPVLTYKWGKEGQAKGWYLEEGEIDEGWQRVLVVEPKITSVDLPCVTVMSGSQYGEGTRPFVSELSYGRRGKWSPQFDQKDALYQRFLARFYEEGTLCLGKRRYFMREARPKIKVVGMYYNPPKVRREPAPRKTYLASQAQDDTEYVYVIRMGRKNVFKIGKSNDPRGRMQSLQSASPYKLSLFHVFRADNASAAEEQLHAALHDAKMEGEWFRLTAEQKEALGTIEAFRNKKFLVNGRSLVAEEMLLGMG
jgi:hypothetical protein